MYFAIVKDYVLSNIIKKHILGELSLNHFFDSTTVVRWSNVTTNNVLAITVIPVTMLVG